MGIMIRTSSGPSKF